MKIHGYAYREPNAPLERIEWETAIDGSNEAIVRVAGCGVCHTDLSFYTGGVAPRHELPLVLGHEISGTVEEASGPAAHLVGQPVLIPAVMPCGDCDRCRAGVPNTCTHQVMPGNDIHGGFASHVRVPAHSLVPLPTDLGSLELADLSVIADAVTTPYQAMERAEVKEGDVVVIIGAGGIGTYGVQIASARGATVIAVDVVPEKLDLLRDFGAHATLCVRDVDPGAGRKLIRAAVKEAGLPSFGWKIFEMSGTPQGQDLAFRTIPPAGTLAVVGFTPKRIEVRLSNLMALDARCFGNWGCEPQLYPDALALVLEGRVRVDPFIEKHPLSKIDEVFELAMNHRLSKRAILVPDERS